MSWYFERLIPSDTILAVEPDGTRHCVKRGAHVHFASLGRANGCKTLADRSPLIE